MNSASDFSADFMKYRGPSTSTNYPSYTTTTDPLMEQPTSSWLHGNDFNSMAGDLFSSAPDDLSYGNLSGINLNLDQFKIGDQTMENVLKALDPSGTKSTNGSNNGNGYNPSSSSPFLNGLNLDSSFTMKPKSKYDNFDYLKPTNRSNIIKSHNTNTNANSYPNSNYSNNNNTAGAQRVSFQHPTTSQFFSSPDESFVNMTLPAMDTSLIFSDKRNVRASTNSSNIKSAAAAVPSYSSSEKEQFVSFAVQQYRMLASLNPEMIRDPQNLEELADRETFKYWAKLFIEERERQARIVLNLQKALTEALSGSAAKGPNVMSHLGAATGDFELETIGKYADQCRKRSQMISKYFNNKK